MQRYHYWGAAAVLLLLPLAGWAGGDADTGAAEEVTEMTWMSQYGDSFAFKDMQERFGVTVTSNEIFENDQERRELMLAAGEQPDFGNFWGDPIEFFEDGLTRSIPKDMIREYAPNVAAIYDAYPLAWITYENPDNPDELLTLNGLAVNTDANISLPFFRRDHSQAVGLELPGYEANKVSLDNVDRVYFLDYDMEWAEFERLLRSYRDQTPGNVEIPLGLFFRSNATNNSYHWNMGSWLGAFGLNSRDGNREVNGKLEFWHTDPAMKDYTNAVATWFSEGLMDREFATLLRQKYWEKGAAGLYGVQSEPYTNAGQTYAGLRTPNNMVPDEQLGQAGAEVVGIPPVIGPGRMRGGSAYSPIAAVGNYKFYANAEVSDAKLIKALEMLDYYFGTKEGWITFRNGEAGTHFDWDGEPYESFARNRAESDIPEGEGHGGISVYPVFYTPDRLDIIAPKALADFQSTYGLVDNGDNLYTMRPYRNDFFNETEFNAVKQRVGSTLEDMWLEFFLGGVTGQLDVDAEWDGFVAKWRAAGGDELLAEIAKSPIVDELRAGRRVY